jgi:hypothetical protein
MISAVLAVLQCVRLQGIVNVGAAVWILTDRCTNVLLLCMCSQSLMNISAYGCCESRRNTVLMEAAEQILAQRVLLVVRMSSLCPI